MWLPVPGPSFLRVQRPSWWEAGTALCVNRPVFPPSSSGQAGRRGEDRAPGGHPRGVMENGQPPTTLPAPPPGGCLPTGTVEAQRSPREPLRHLGSHSPTARASAPSLAFSVRKEDGTRRTAGILMACPLSMTGPRPRDSLLAGSTVGSQPEGWSPSGERLADGPWASAPWCPRGPLARAYPRAFAPPGPPSPLGRHCCPGSSGRSCAPPPPTA